MPKGVPAPVFCSLCLPRSVTAMYVVGSKGYCEGHRAEAYAAAAKKTAASGQYKGLLSGN